MVLSLPMDRQRAVVTDALNGTPNGLLDVILSRLRRTFPGRSFVKSETSSSSMMS